MNRVLPADEVYAGAVVQARGFARGPRLALAAAKDAIHRSAHTGLREGLQAERSAFCRLFDTSDQTEGMAAFLEKRAPEFEGR